MEKRKQTRTRRGSALIMVLGILSVLLLMAVAFSSFVRTERSGSTNLKNGVVARDSLYTALGRVMEAIDASFDSPLGDDPVPAWPHPWIASEGSFTNDYFQSAALADGEAAGAHVLTSEIAQYLSPAQLALARSARCNWAPIVGSINASPRFRDPNEHRGGIQGVIGRPSGDDLLGRYAFIALDTTGLADINMTGGGTAADRLETSGSDTLSLVIPSSLQASDGTTIARYVKSPSTLVDKRNFNSLADARARAPSAFNADDLPENGGDWYPADLFAGFAPSLAELDPEGNPKIFLPTRKKLSGYGKDDFKALVRRTFRAMVGIFARGRVAAGERAKNYSADQIPIFSGSNEKYNLSRSALATVALMDGLDADFIPGQSVNPACPYWSFLPDVSVQVTDKDGKTVTVEEETSGSGNPLNYPCTESAPLLSSVYAFIKIDEPVDDESDPDPLNWTRTYNGYLFVGGCAACQNRTIEPNKHKAKLEITYEVMAGHPTDKTVSGGDATDIQNNLVEWKTEGDDFGNGGEERIVWTDFFGATDSASEEDEMDDGDEDKSLIFVACEPHSFTIKCAWDDSNGDYYPPVRYAADGGTEDVFVPVRIKAKVTSGSTTIQQVPAKAIDSKDWWIRVDAGVWHGPDSKFGQADQFVDPKDGEDPADAKNHAVGWAFCAVPAFGFDTTGLATTRDGDEERPVDNAVMHFWVNNVMARNGGEDDFGNASEDFAAIMEDFFYASDATQNAWQEASGGGAFGNKQFLWNYVQMTWLFNYSSNPEDSFSHVTQWMDTSASFHRPDMLHALGTPARLKGIYQNDWKKHASFVGTDVITYQGQQFPDSQRLASELYSRIPANGYETVADLGTVMCGPYETLSLFKTWRYNSEKADFHPVLDYFTVDEDRYPSRKDVLDAGVDNSGDVAWGNLDEELRSAAHNGRVNLNAPPLVECTKIRTVGGRKVPVRGLDDQDGYLNPFPIATVLNRAPYPAISDDGTITTNNLKEAPALLMAAELCRSLEEADEDNPDLWVTSRRWHCIVSNTLDVSSGAQSAVRPVVTNSWTTEPWPWKLSDWKKNQGTAYRWDRGRGVVRRPVARNLSFLGRGGKDQNGFLRTFVDNTTPKPLCDYEREGILRGIVDGFSTRGQTYLVIIRADAYSPKFGENATVEDGTTLATTHAVVELFRDPVPARYPDGELPDDGDDPVAHHNWYVRSFRVF